MKLVLECAKTHDGDMNKAKEMIRDVASNGVYAVKFQSYDLKDLVKKHKNYKRNKKCHLTIDQLKELKDYAELQGLKFWCSAFSESVLKPLREFTDTIKIPSTYFSHLSFVHKCIDIFPNVHISTSIDSRETVLKTIEEYRKSGKNIILYHTVCLYPPDTDKVSRINDINADGFSCHSTRIDSIISALNRGVKFTEIHYGAWHTKLDDLATRICEEFVHNHNSPVSKKEIETREFYRNEYHGLMEAYVF